MSIIRDHIENSRELQVDGDIGTTVVSVKLNQAVPVTPDANTDYTLTTDENLFGRLVLVDGSWTAPHNIIIDNTERDFLVDNSAGTYTATIKTVAGTGIAVEAGTKVWLLCDGTDVIESVDGTEVFTGGLSVDNFFHAQDQKTSGTNAGSSIAGFQTRILNTVLVNTIVGASLSANEITMPAGDYYIEASAPAGLSNEHKLSLRNTFNNVDLLVGTSEYSNASGGTLMHTRSLIVGKFTLALEKTITLRHYIQSARATDGLGRDTLSGQIEVYADIKIWKVG